MSSYGAALASCVQSFLVGEIGFDEFEILFDEIFLERTPDDALESHELAMFGEVNERLTWTAVHPTAADRGDGWLDRREFTEWLRDEFSRWSTRYE